MFKSFSYKSIVSIVFLIAIMMEIIDVTIVNVALPKIRTVLNADINLLSWVTNGYVLSLATAIPLSSWLGERYGTKKIFIIGINLFTFASILCGFANNVHFLIFARVLQGIGGGMLVPVGQTILFRSFEAAEIPALLSKLSIPLTLAPALGQTLGGLLVEYFDWHWIFWVNIPFGIFCFLTTKKYILESDTNKNKLDFIGLFLSNLAVFLLFYSFSIIHFDASFLEPSLFFISSIILLIIFVLYERKIQNPFFNLAVFSYRNFSLSILSNLFVFSNIMGMFYISNFIFQETLGWTSLEAGLTAIPFSLGFLFAVKMIPRIYPKKINTVPLLMSANFVCIVSGILMDFIYSKHQFNFLLFISLLRGVSFGFLIIVLQSVGLIGIKKELMGDASSVVTLTRYTFVGFGTALFTVLTIVFMQHYAIIPVSFTSNKSHAMQVFYWLNNISIVFLVVACAFILRLKDPTPEELNPSQTSH